MTEPFLDRATLYSLFVVNKLSHFLVSRHLMGLYHPDATKKPILLRFSSYLRRDAVIVGAVTSTQGAVGGRRLVITAGTAASSQSAIGEHLHQHLPLVPWTI